jgi:alpha-D-xyloside xylohydrolase
VRWFQYGAFCPMFRVHGTGPREMWRYGDVGTPHYETQMKFDHLRYRLLPYIYSLAARVTFENDTMMRALVMDFPEDKRVLNIDDQFMFGPSLLVNPVTEYKARSRRVYLPKAEGWFDFWTGKAVRPGVSINAPAAFESMPLYVRAGSIVPMGPFMEYATEKPADPIELRIYPGADGAFTIYEDENDNYNYEKGACARIPISWNDAERKLTISHRRGNFPGMLRERTFRAVVVGRGHGTGIEVSRDADMMVRYDGAPVTVKV